MFTTKTHSSRRVRGGQFRLSPSLGRAFVGLLLIVAMVALVGCKSFYEKTHAALPPEPVAELRLRITEAQEAQDFAGQAARKLQENLKRGLKSDVIQTDFDRLEAAAFDLVRRVLAARDIQARCGETGELAGQIELLQRRAVAFQAYVQGSRQADAATQARELDVLLRDPLFKL